MTTENNAHLEALLAAHLDALWTAPDAARTLRTQTTDPEAKELMRLAERLDLALTPVMPSAAFVEHLRGEFLTQAPPSLLERWRKLPPRYQTAAKVGAGTLTAGIMYLAARRAWGFWSGQRTRHSEVAEPALSLPSAP